MKEGQLIQVVLKEGSCLSAILPEKEDYEVMFIHEEFSNFTYSILLCGSVMPFNHKKNGEERFHLTKESIGQNCQGKA